MTKSDFMVPVILREPSPMIVSFYFFEFPFRKTGGVSYRE